MAGGTQTGANDLPPHEIGGVCQGLCALGIRFQRAAVSAMTNIAEGFDCEFKAAICSLSRHCEAIRRRSAVLVVHGIGRRLH